MILKFWNTLLKFWTTILKFRNTILMPKNCKFFLNVDQPKFLDLTVAICSNNEVYIFVGLLHCGKINRIFLQFDSPTLKPQKKMLL
jgi:hypothetical protein